VSVPIDKITMIKGGAIFTDNAL